MHIHAFDYPKAQGEPAMGKSIHRNGKLLIPNWYCETRKVKAVRLITTTRHIFSSNEQALWVIL